MVMRTQKMDMYSLSKIVGTAGTVAIGGSKHLAGEVEPMPYPPDESVGNATHLCFLTLRSCVSSTAL